MAEEFIIAGWLDYGPNRDQVLKHFTVVAAASRDELRCFLTRRAVCFDDTSVRIVHVRRSARDRCDSCQGRGRA